MKVRRALRIAAAAGFIAIVAQVAVYTHLARQDERGTSRRSFSADAGDSRITLRYPNTWKRDVQSRRPEFRLLLQGPQGSQIQIVASSATLSAVQKPADRTRDPLVEAHSALKDVASAGLSGYTEDAPDLSKALQTDSLVSVVRASRRGTSFRGFRYTMIAGSRVWSILALTPERRWRRSLPFLREIVTSVRVS